MSARRNQRIDEYFKEYLIRPNLSCEINFSEITNSQMLKLSLNPSKKVLVIRLSKIDNLYQKNDFTLATYIMEILPHLININEYNIVFRNNYSSISYFML